MDRGVLHGIFDRVDTQRRRVVPRRELLAAFAEDENLHVLLGLGREHVNEEMRRSIRSAFAQSDDHESPLVTFDEFASYLEVSLAVASQTHGEPQPQPQPEPEPQGMLSEPFRVGGQPAASQTMAEKLNRLNRWRSGEVSPDAGTDAPSSHTAHSYSATSQSSDRSAQKDLAQQIAELERRAAAAELEQSKRGTTGSNELSRDELDVQQQLIALEHEHLGARASDATGGNAQDRNGNEYPVDSGTAAVAGKTEAELFMERRRSQRMAMMQEHDDGSNAVQDSYAGPSYGARPPPPGEGLPPRGLVAEVYAPLNPHGRSVWQHTLYGQQPPDGVRTTPDGQQPFGVPIGHRSVSEAGEVPPSPAPSDGVAERCRTMLQERTGSHVPSPRAMLSPARVIRAWSPTRTSGDGSAGLSGSVAQRSRDLAAVRRSPPRNRNGTGGDGGEVGARQRLISAGRLAGRVSTGLRGSLQGQDTLGAVSLSHRAEATPRRGSPLSPGRSVPKRQVAGAVGAAQLLERTQALPHEIDVRSPEARVPERRDGLVERAAVLSMERRSPRSTPKPTVDMSDLEQMKARRQSRARGVLDSVNANFAGSTGTDTGVAEASTDTSVVEDDMAHPGTQSQTNSDSTSMANPSRSSSVSFRSPGRDARAAPEDSAADSRHLSVSFRSLGRDARAAPEHPAADFDQSQTEAVQISTSMGSLARNSPVRFRSPGRDAAATDGQSSAQGVVEHVETVLRAVGSLEPAQVSRHASIRSPGRDAREAPQHAAADSDAYQSQTEAVQISTSMGSLARNSPVRFRSPGRDAAATEKPSAQGVVEHVESLLRVGGSLEPAQVSRHASIRSPGRDAREAPEHPVTRSRVDRIQSLSPGRSGTRRLKSARRVVGTLQAFEHAQTSRHEKIRSPGRDGLRGSLSRSRQRISGGRVGTHSPGRQGNSASATGRQSTAEFLSRLAAIGSTGRSGSERAGSRQRDRGPASVPDLPWRDRRPETARAGWESPGRSSVERPGSRGRGAGAASPSRRAQVNLLQAARAVTNAGAMYR